MSVMSPQVNSIDYDALCIDLEKKELDAPNGVPPGHVYQQLLAIYLLQNDLTGAKFLWQRIPNSSKTATPELAKIWEVGRCLWQRDLPSVYGALTIEWSPTVKPIMAALRDKLDGKSVHLVSLAFSSIGLEDLGQFFNLSPDDALKRSKELGWAFDEDTRMVLPTNPPPKPIDLMSSETQLRRLADYVSFLEN